MIDQFRCHLKSRGLHCSQAREIVVRAVCRMNRHFGAEELAARLDEGPNRVSRGTVYRTLNLLERFGLVRRVGGDGGSRRYEQAAGCVPHDHLVCEQCGRTIEFTDPAFPRALQRICRERGFRSRTYRLSVIGICAACARKEKPKRS